MPSTTPTRPQPCERSAGSSVIASKAMNNGEVATRMPASADGTWFSPKVIRPNGTMTCAEASASAHDLRAHSCGIAPERIAIGRRTAAPRIVRAQMMKPSDRSPSSATLMNMYDAPHSAAVIESESQARRFMVRSG